MGDFPADNERRELPPKKRQTAQDGGQLSRSDSANAPKRSRTDADFGAQGGQEKKDSDGKPLAEASQLKRDATNRNRYEAASALPTGFATSLNPAQSSAPIPPFATQQDNRTIPLSVLQQLQQLQSATEVNTGSAQATQLAIQRLLGQVATPPLQQGNQQELNAASLPLIQSQSFASQSNPVAGAPILYLPGLAVQSMVTPTTFSTQQQQQLAAIAQLQQLAALNALAMNGPNQPQNLLTQSLFNSTVPPVGSSVSSNQAVVLQGNTPLSTSGPTGAASAPLPGQSTQHEPVVAYLERDAHSLSEYQCLVRKQIEFFAASAEDASSNAQGRNKKIVYDQVGIRCRHCAWLTPRFRTRASVYYPQKLDGIYQAAQNMASMHLCVQCTYVPDEVREHLVRSKDRKSSAGGGKQYWADGARELGIVEHDETGLRFA